MKLVWVKIKDGHERLVDLDADEPRGTRGGGKHFSAEEKRKLHYQTGVHFDSYSQFKTWCRVSGRRCIEKGEEQDRLRKETAEWVDGGSKGEPPGKWTPDPRTRPNVDKMLQEG